MRKEMTVTHNNMQVNIWVKDSNRDQVESQISCPENERCADIFEYNNEYIVEFFKKSGAHYHPEMKKFYTDVYAVAVNCAKNYVTEKRA